MGITVGLRAAEAWVVCRRILGASVPWLLLPCQDMLGIRFLDCRLLWQFHPLARPSLSAQPRRHHGARVPSCLGQVVSVSPRKPRQASGASPHAVQTCPLEADLAVSKYYEVWNGLNAETRGQSRLSLCIDLKDQSLTAYLAC